MITFDRDSHTYTNESGVRIPSVTQILGWLYPEKYANVPQMILNDAADFGNKIHEWVEEYAMTGKKKRADAYTKLSTTQAVELICLHDFHAERCEQIISYQNHYAGMFDMYGTMEGIPTLIDIKTTAQMDQAYLEWQLGMYKVALEEEGIPVDQTYCFWLPRGSLAKMIRIEPRSRDDIDWLMYRYETEHYSN